MYQTEKARIVLALGTLVRAIEHIGSTSVPGLAAKPTIDTLVGIGNLADIAKCIEPLEQIGYQHRPAFEAQFPGGHYFRRRNELGQHTHHIHVTEFNSEFWQRHIAFRDYLRAHPRVGKQYEELKRDLARQFPNDRKRYTEGKSAFIREIEKRASHPSL
jgi:GrpB-like predicted nucleotidyltransferase (UPF0157 family)